MTPSRVSVIIPTYNRAHLIVRAIQSALRNTLPHDEILIVDDASTDDTAAVVRPFTPNVRYLLAPHGGAGAARNFGLRHATGDLVAFLDSDDEWEPDKLALQRAVLDRRPEVLFCCSNFSSRTENSAVAPGFLDRWHKDRRPWDQILGPGATYSSIASLPNGRADFPVHVGSFYRLELLADYMATSTVMVRRLEAGDALRFAEDLPISEDKACFARVASRGLGAYFAIDLAIQWGHGGPRASDTNLYTLATTKLLLIDQIWQSDPVFVRAYAADIDRIRRANLLKRARWLLARGRTAEARADLRQVANAPLSYRALAALPGPAARSALALRRWLAPHSISSGR